MRADDYGMSRLEHAIGLVLWLGVVLSSILLGVGLFLTLVAGEGRIASMVLTTAIVILLATPATRVAISAAEYVRERDWLFVALTLIVLLTLAGSVAVAFRSAVA